MKKNHKNKKNLKACPTSTKIRKINPLQRVGVYERKAKPLPNEKYPTI